VGLSNVDNTSDAGKPLSNAAISALNTLNTALNNHLNAINPHNVTKITVGLGNVDNTSDANKSLSIAAALDNAAIEAKIAVAGQTDSIGVLVADLINKVSVLLDNTEVNDGSTPIGVHVENILTVMESFDESVIQGILASITTLNNLTSTHSTQISTINSKIVVGDNSTPIGVHVDNLLAQLTNILLRLTNTETVNATQSQSIINLTSTLSNVTNRLTTAESTLTTHTSEITDLDSRVTTLEETVNSFQPSTPFNKQPVIPMPIALAPIDTTHAGGNTLAFTMVVKKSMFLLNVSVQGTNEVPVGEEFSMEVTVGSNQVFANPIVITEGNSDSDDSNWSFDGEVNSSYSDPIRYFIPAGSRLSGTVITGGELLNPVMWLEWCYADMDQAYVEVSPLV
jgi:hypothetical protein